MNIPPNIYQSSPIGTSSTNDSQKRLSPTDRRIQNKVPHIIKTDSSFSTTSIRNLAAQKNITPAAQLSPKTRQRLTKISEASLNQLPKIKSSVDAESHQNISNFEKKENKFIDTHQSEFIKNKVLNQQSLIDEKKDIENKTAHEEVKPLYESQLTNDEVTFNIHLKKLSILEAHIEADIEFITQKHVNTNPKGLCTELSQDVFQLFNQKVRHYEGNRYLLEQEDFEDIIIESDNIVPLKENLTEERKNEIKLKEGTGQILVVSHKELEHFIKHTTHKMQIEIKRRISEKQERASDQVPNSNFKGNLKQESENIGRGERRTDQYFFVKPQDLNKEIQAKTIVRTKAQEEREIQEEEYHNTVEEIKNKDSKRIKKENEKADNYKTELRHKRIQKDEQRNNIT